jgi:F420H(2)-dependent quinone reductase
MRLRTNRPERVDRTSGREYKSTGFNIEGFLFDLKPELPLQYEPAFLLLVVNVWWWEGFTRQVVARCGHVQQRVCEGEERQQLYDAQAAVMPNFAEYQKKTSREIPVVVPEPRRQS